MVRFARKEEELEVVMMLLEVLVMMPLENNTLASCRTTRVSGYAF